MRDSTQAHTELPWQLGADQRSVYPNKPDMDGGGHSRVAACGGRNEVIKRANADLIVQAVNSHYELLEALEGLLEECVNRTHDLSTEWWDKARAAIAKAKGETL